MRQLLISTAIAGVMLLAGCNKKPDSASANTKPEASRESSAAQSSSAADHGGSTAATAESHAAPVHPETAKLGLNPDATPDDVVKAFLEATRSGDDQLAAQLLSKKAIEATTQAGLIVKPPGTPSMKYEIGEVEYPEKHADGAYVKSVWRERFDDGEEHFDITWVLRKQSAEGWRIVGMAVQLPGAEVPDLINFEAAEELKLMMAEAAGEATEESAATDETGSEDAATSDETFAEEEGQEEAPSESRAAQRPTGQRNSLR